MSESEKFFSRKNLHKAGWAFIFALVGLLGGFLVYKIKGPQKIIVTEGYTPKPIVVYIEKTPGTKNVISVDPNSMNDLKELFKTDHQNPHEPNRIQIPPYRKPETVKGYTKASLFGVTEVECPPKLIKKGDIIKVMFKLTDSSLLESITPIHVDIVKPETSTTTIQVFQQQYEIRRDVNLIQLIVDITPGKYILSYGFFNKNELRQEYPNFYSKECNLTVAP